MQGKFPAILFSGYNGESQGTALADVMFGQQDPSGHLDFTWYKDDSQLPPMADYGLTPARTGGLGRTYLYFTGTPTYPFGYGLSYTTFAYSGVAVDQKSVSADGTVHVSFTVTNTGSTPGATVAQLYAATPFTVPGVELPKPSGWRASRRPRSLQPGAEPADLASGPDAASLAVWDAASDEVGRLRRHLPVPGGRQRGDIRGSADGQRAPAALTPHVQSVTVQPDQVDLPGRATRWT